VRRADSEKGGEILQLIIEDIGQLFGTSSPPCEAGGVANGINDPPSPQMSCTLEFVLVSTTECIRNLQSPAQLLYRLVQGLLVAFQPLLDVPDDDALAALRATLPPKPNYLSHIRLHLSDRRTHVFPTLHALFEAPLSPGGYTTASSERSSAASTPSIDLTNMTAGGQNKSQHVVVWLRDPSTHSEWFLQLGHALYPFLNSTKPAEGSSAWVGVLDSGNMLTFDATATKRHQDQKPKTLGTTVSRSVLRYPRVDATVALHAQLLRQSLGLAFGRTTSSIISLEDAPLPTTVPSQEAKGISRTFPVQSPLILFTLDANRSIGPLSAMARARRRDMPELASAPSPAGFLGRLFAFVAGCAPSPSVGSSTQAAEPVTSSRALVLREGVVVVGGGMMRVSSATPYASSPTHEMLLSALHDAVYTYCQLNKQQSTDEGNEDTTIDGAGGGTGGGPSWLDAVRAFATNPSQLYLDMANSDPLIAPCLASIMYQCDRNCIEHGMEILLPRPSVLSRVIPVAADGVDEEEGTPCTIVKRYVQTLSPKYLMDAAAGRVQDPVSIAEAIEAALLVAQQASLSAATAPTPLTSDKKKRSNVS
jgi:hypothetical protein